MESLVAQLMRFEELVMEDAPLSQVLPALYKKNINRYAGYTIRRLCQEMHDFYKQNDAKTYQKRLFRSEYLPKRGMVQSHTNNPVSQNTIAGEACANTTDTSLKVITAQEAKWALVRNNAKLVPLDNIVGEIALEGALPYPPGVFCVVPGEVWSETAQKYFTILQDGINLFPGFAPEIQGVYLEKENDKARAYGYVLDKKKI
jgi:ornithine decarboxylase